MISNSATVSGALAPVNPYPIMPRKTSHIPYAARSEKAIERYFAAQIRLLGLPCIKQFNPYEAGWPDRLVALPDGRVLWVEFKSTGEKPTKLQEYRHNALAVLGHTVYVIATRIEAESLIAHIKELL